MLLEPCPAPASCNGTGPATAQGTAAAATLPPPGAIDASSDAAEGAASVQSHASLHSRGSIDVSGLLSSTLASRDAGAWGSCDDSRLSGGSMLGSTLSSVDSLLGEGSRRLGPRSFPMLAVVRLEASVWGLNGESVGRLGHSNAHVTTGKGSERAIGVCLDLPPLSTPIPPL